MILLLEIGLAIVGLIALFGGKFTISKTKVVHGAAARLLGVLCLTPLPLAILAAVLYIQANNPADPQRFAEDNRWTLTGIEAGIVIGVAVLVFVIGAAVATDPAEEKRRRRDEYDAEGEDRDEWDRR